MGGPEGRDAGSKACLAAMDALQVANSGLHRKILDNLPGNEEWLAQFLFAALRNYEAILQVK
jgi:hypothetical protein